MAIIFSGHLNLVSIDSDGSKFTKSIAIVVNAINLAMFCLALPILHEPQIYVGILIFLVSIILFVSMLVKVSLETAE